MPVKEKLSRISLSALLPQKEITRVVTFSDEPLRSSLPSVSKNTIYNTVFTGRVKELDYLKQLFVLALQCIKDSSLSKETSKKNILQNENDNRPVIAAITGEPGIGKSRLAGEFILRLKNSAGLMDEHCIYGNSFKSGQSDFGLFRHFINIRAITGKADSSRNSYQPATEDTKHRIKEKLFSKARDARKNNLPLVIFFDDMQWADELSLDVIDHIIRSINLFDKELKPQIFLILTYRRGYKPSKALRQECVYRELKLEGLNKNDCRLLMENLEQAKNIPMKQHAEIIKRSEGNPFGLEEWCRSAGKNKTKVPESIRHIITEKVNFLTPGERAVLITACVIGRKFELNLVKKILQLAGKPLPAKETIDFLTEERFIVNLTGSIFEFRHDILQETIYRFLVKDIKTNIHLLAGWAIENLYSGRLNEYYYELARHYTCAGDEAKRTEYLEKAGDKAKNNYEHQKALRFYGQLLENVSGNRRFEIIFKMCDVHMNRSEWDKQINYCREILNSSRRLDKSTKAECYKRIGDCKRVKGIYNEAMVNYKYAKINFNKIFDTEGTLNVLEQESRILIEKGNYQQAITNFLNISQISKTNNFNVSYKNSLIGLSVGYCKIGRYNDAFSVYHTLLELGIKQKDKRIIALSYLNMGEAYYYLGELSESLNTYIKTYELAKKSAFLDIVTKSLGNIGVIYYSKKKYKYSLKYFNKQLNSFKYLGNLAGIGVAYGMLGSCYFSLGKIFRAIDYYKKQLIIGKKILRKQAKSLSYGNLGIVYCSVGDFKKSMFFLKKQFNLDFKISNYYGIVRYYINIGILYKLTKKYFLSIKMFERALHYSNKYKIFSNLDILHSYLSESYFEINSLQNSLSNAQLAIKFAQETNNRILIIHTEAIIAKIKLKNIYPAKNGIGNLDISLFKSLINEFKNKTFKTVSNEEKGLYYFELFKMYQYSNKYFTLNKAGKIYGIKAFKIYKELYKKKCLIEFKIRINELKPNII